MIKRFWSLPIRMHLVVLLCLLACPFVVLIMHLGISERREAIAAAQRENMRFVNVAANTQQSLVAGIEQLVMALSFLSELRMRNVEATNVILVDLVKKNPHLTNIAVMETTGLIWGTAAAFPGQVSLGDRRYFINAVRTGEFSSGEYTVGRISTKPIMNFGYPVKDESQQPIAVIGVGLDLEYIQRNFKTMNMPAGSSFSLLDHQGTTLFRDVENSPLQASVGKRQLGIEVFTVMEEGPKEGTFEGVGSEGDYRLFAYRKIALPKESTPYLYICSSIPRDAVAARANTAMFKHLSTLALVFIGVLLLAWFIGRHAIVERITMLKAASRKLAEGVETVNVSNWVKGGELGELAQAFDGMAEALASREKAKSAAEAALRESEGKFRDLSEKSMVGIYLLQDDLVKYANAMLAEIVGCGVDEIIGKMNPKEVVYPEDWPSIKGYLLGEVQTSRYEFRIVRRDGAIRQIEAYSSRTIYQGKPATVGTLLDITERKRVEEEARRLRNYLSNIVNSMPSVLVGVDANGCVTQWNAAAAKATGVGAEKAQGQPLDQVLPAMDRQLERLRQAMRTRTVETEAKVARTVNGEVRYEDVTVYPLMSNGVEGAVIRVDDVTERVRIEEMMVQSEKMLSIGGLAAGMAHEINNPLGVILQAVQNVFRRVSPALPANVGVAEECGISLSGLQRYFERREVLSFLEDIRQSGQRAAEIVSNMLSFSRKAEGEGSAVDMAELLDRTVVLAASDYDLKKHYDFRQIEIVRDYDPDVPQVVCQPGKIQQVFLNILRNGAEAMMATKEAGQEPRFVLRVIREAEMVRVEIEDNGPGMDEATRRRVFEPFFTTKPPGSGTGLGLSVSYFIVIEDHGGAMAVESAPGGGTRFIIKLPVVGSRP